MPKTCPQCQSEAADEATTCPSCGAALGAAATATAAPPPPAAPPRPRRRRRSRTSTGSTIPAFKFDAARWSLADRIAGVAHVVLFISLFLSWFGITRHRHHGTASGLSAHGWLYVVLILCILISPTSSSAPDGTSSRSARTSRTSRR